MLKLLENLLLLNNSLLTIFYVHVRLVLHLGEHDFLLLENVFPLLARRCAVVKKVFVLRKELLSVRGENAKVFHLFSLI